MQWLAVGLTGGATVGLCPGTGRGPGPGVGAGLCTDEENIVTGILIPKI